MTRATSLVVEHGASLDMPCAYSRVQCAPDPQAEPYPAHHEPGLYGMYVCSPCLRYIVLVVLVSRPDETEQAV